MIISHSHKFIYFHAPKTAGTSVQKFLWSVCDHKKDFLAPSVKEVGYENLSSKLFNHSDVKFIKKNYEDLYNEYSLVGNVRNPWDRNVSQYFFNQFRIRLQDWTAHITSVYPEYDPYESFELFTKRKNYGDKLDTLVNFYDNTKIDFFIRFESLEKDLRSLLNFLNINKPVVLGHDKKIKKDGTPVRKHTDYRIYYNEQTKKIIEKKFQDDIKAFRYTF